MPYTLQRHCLNRVHQIAFAFYDILSTLSNACFIISIPVHDYIPGPINREHIGDQADAADVSCYGRWRNPSAQWEHRSLDSIGPVPRKRKTQDEIRRDLEDELKDL